MEVKYIGSTSKNFKKMKTLLEIINTDSEIDIITILIDSGKFGK